MIFEAHLESNTQFMKHESHTAWPRIVEISFIEFDFGSPKRVVKSLNLQYRVSVW